MTTRKHPQARCEECPLQKQAYVPTEFNNPELFIVGEAPGGTEAREGRPFVGQSGKLLGHALANEDLSREAASFTNVVSCRPKGNADPPKEAVDACNPRLESELKGTKTILATGNSAASAILGTKTKITRDRVGPPKHSPLYPGISIIPTFHPAACLRNPDSYPSLETDIAKIHNASRVAWSDPDYRVFGDHEDTVMGARIALEQILQREELDPLAMDIEVGEEKDESFGHPERLLSIAISYSGGAGIVIGESGLQDRKVRQLLNEIISTKRTIWHNSKYDLQVLYNLGVVSGRAYYDTMLASYVLDERSGTHGLKYLAKELLGAPDWDKELKEMGGFEDAPRPALYRYNAYDAVATYRLYELQREDPRWDDNCETLMGFLMRAQHVLMHIEIEGIKVDEDALEQLRIELEQDIYEWVCELQPQGREWIDIITNHNPDVSRMDILEYCKDKKKDKYFNPNSWQQVKKRLAELGVKTSGTDKEHMQYIIEQCNEIIAGAEYDPTTTSLAAYEKAKNSKQFAQDILEYRKVKKLHGTYVKGTQLRLHNGRIHTTFSLHLTTTGRTSSRNINIQNVPRGKRIRSMYVPEDGNTFVQLDYKNIEGRIVFVLSECETGRNILEEGRDIHGEVASQVYGPNYTKEQRVHAKSVVHGVNYGRTPHGIASDPNLDVTLYVAEEIFGAYKALVPEVFRWHKFMEKRIFSNEDLVTPFGRKRRFALVTKENRDDVYKEGLAFLPQSIASDLALSGAMELWNKGFAIRNFMHDGLLIEAPQDEAEEQAKKAQEILEEVPKKVYTDWISFPVDYDIGQDWGVLE